jgi:hypothetical protein
VQLYVTAAHNLINKSENNYESTFLEPPETPAHQFAVKAFKHAIFGTPAPEDANNAPKRHDKKVRIDAANAKVTEIPAPKEADPPLSPSKQPGGILMTPGTANKGRKTVSFGSHVVDNEGKRGNNAGRSGIPNDCPGKFPSPWTPGTELKLEVGSERRPHTKLTEALLDARTTTLPKVGPKPRAKDDTDITIDLGAPRSESGKYWKEQYESYAERSEKEMKKVIAKQQLAKKFAMKKDSEVTELTTKIEQERKRFRQRERDLEQQNKDFQERLRQAMADKTSASIEIAALKARVAILENSNATTSSEIQRSKEDFQIYEDVSKDVVQPMLDQENAHEVSFAPSISMASSGKENNSPKPRHHRRQPLPASHARSSVPSRLGTADGEASILLARSPRAPVTSSTAGPESALPPQSPELPSKSPLRTRKDRPSKENNIPPSPAPILPSSPLPMPSPGIDPWMDLHSNSIPQMDKMAMPNYSGQPYSRPEWNPPPRKHRVSKSVLQTKRPEASRPDSRTEKPVVFDKNVGAPQIDNGTTDEHAGKLAARLDAFMPKADKMLDLEKPKAETHNKLESASTVSPTDPKFDLSKITTHHAEGSSQVKKDRAEILPEDRKEQAKRRLEERKKLRKNAPS